MNSDEEQKKDGGPPRERLDPREKDRTDLGEKGAPLL